MNASCTSDTPAPNAREGQSLSLKLGLVLTTAVLALGITATLPSARVDFATTQAVEVQAVQRGDDMLPSRGHTPYAPAYSQDEAIDIAPKAPQVIDSQHAQQDLLLACAFAALLLLVATGLAYSALRPHGLRHDRVAARRADAPHDEALREFAAAQESTANAMRDALDARDMGAAAQLATTLALQAQAIGAHELAALGRTMERALLARDLTAARRTAASIAAPLQRLLEEVSMRLARPAFPSAH
ncbi:hypothetical protein [Niveibacterium sp. SC-1]|uniref:hypothetical protein n=1 Tax=Niveibacterium sp. SC-1 TaxID=3135646 RepID=UPI0031200D7B